MAQAVSEPDGIVHFSAGLAEIDAIVTDSHGRHISDLSPDELELLQDGKRQKITQFRFVPTSRIGDVTASTPTSPIGTTPSQFGSHRTFVVFLDDLDMSFGEYAMMRRDLFKFIDSELQSGDLWAFYKTTGGSGAWQTFSSDRREIRSAVEHMKWLPQPESATAAEKDVLPFFDAIKRAILELGTLPGRKTLILLNSGMSVGMQRTGEVMEKIRDVSDAANKASVKVESIDLRGLPAGAGMANNWADASHRYAEYSPPNMEGHGIIQPASAPPTNVPRPMQYMMSQSVAQRIANQTGGLFLHDRNDFYNELKLAENDDEGYYLLGWDPGKNVSSDKRYHDLEIKVHRRGLVVRSRAGFFGLPAATTPHPSFAPETQLEEALFSPFRSEGIDVELNASFQHNDRDGSYIQSQVHVAPAGLHFEEKSPGCYSTNIEIATVPRPLAFDSANQTHLTSQMTTLEACGQTGGSLVRDGFVYLIRSKVEAPGPYEMRIAIRNTVPGDQSSIGQGTTTASERPLQQAVQIGSATEFLEIPDLRKKMFVLSGIQLKLDGAQIPEGILTGKEGKTFEMSYRAPVMGDPAVRHFHSGDTISYESQLFADEGVQSIGTLQIVREGKLVHSEPIALDAKEINGIYKIDVSTAPGHYLLGIAAEERHGKKSGRTTSQWIDFDVVK